MAFDCENGPVEYLEVMIQGQRWTLERTAALEILWEAIGSDGCGPGGFGPDDFGEDERLPYWAELWPASFVLADWLGRNAARLDGRLCLDMGCGLGLTALLASKHGAHVVGLDYEWPALYFARRNVFLNEVPSPMWVQMDWRWSGFRQAAFPFIWGGDIMYEKRFAEPVARFVEGALAPGGVFWLAEPNRSVYEYFIKQMKSQGWNCSRIDTVATRPPYAAKVTVTVNLWEFTRRA